MLLPLAMFAQIRLQGTVVDDSDGSPLPGVTVTIDGTSKTTVTDFDGQYTITADGKGTVVFTFVGMNTERRSFSSAGTINVRMTEDNKLLDELVVVGYGTMKKSDLTGSVASISADKLKKTPAANLDQALQGRAAGVTVNANSGQPGAGAEVRIRGIGTVNDASPVYVVDGVICNDINFLSPSDIATTEILKDASATAIYGSRGANGVVLITTKKGEKGQSHVSLDLYYGWQQRWRKLDLMNKEDFWNTYIALNASKTEKAYIEKNNGDFNAWLWFAKTRGDNHYWQPKTESNPDGFDYAAVDHDWQDEVFRTAPIQNYHVSVDGGTDLANYSFSASFFKQDGIIKGSDYNRFTLRANTSFDVKKWLRIGENLSYVYSWGRNASTTGASMDSNLLSQAISMAPWDPAYYPIIHSNPDERNKWEGQVAPPSNFKNVYTPISMLQSSPPQDKTSRWIGDIYLEIKPIDGLTYRADVSYDHVNVRHRLFKDKYEVSSYDNLSKNFLERSLAHYTTLVWENTLTYTKQLTDKHFINFMVGQTSEEFNYNSISGSGSAILLPEENNWYLSQTTEDKGYTGDSVNRTRRMSWLGRFHYTLMDRYMATVNFRADGSNRFPENTWGFFPSVALGWRVSEEAFMKNVTWLDNLKLRLGWGQIGNDKIANNAFNQTIFHEGPTFVTYPFNGNYELNGATILTYVNQGGKWEKTETWNVGVDASFWHGLLTVTADAFIRDTKDMLLTVKGPAWTGNRYDAQSNVGTVRNKGIELTLGHQNTIGKVHYAIDGNISFIDNKLTALNGGEKVWDGIALRLCDEGLPLYTFWGYDYQGVYRTDEEAEAALPGYTAAGNVNPYHAGDARFVDINKDGIINDDDKTNLGSPFPWLTYGLNIAADWNGFDLSLFFQGVGGAKIYNMMRTRTEGSGLQTQLSNDMKNVWTVDNPNGTIPNPLGNSANSAYSSRYVENGNYLRLKNLQLGYSLPNNIARKIGMSRCRIYVSANNVWTVTKYKGYDPEVGGGVDWGNYPQARTYMVGANISF